MPSRHPAFLIDDTALVPLRQAPLEMRQGLRMLEDYARQLQREREAVDPDGQHPDYEPLRQRERAAHEELARLRASIDRLLLVLRDLGQDMQRLVKREAEDEA